MDDDGQGSAGSFTVVEYGAIYLVASKSCLVAQSSGCPVGQRLILKRSLDSKETRYLRPRTSSPTAKRFHRAYMTGTLACVREFWKLSHKQQVGRHLDIDV